MVNFVDVARQIDREKEFDDANSVKADAAHAEFLAESPEPAIYGAINVGTDGVARIGDWIQTFTGKKFHLLDPRPEDFCVEDIAHALSNICRFTGHVSTFYSVAEHAVRVAWRVSHTHPHISGVKYGGYTGMELGFQALNHDDTEAYLTDVARPFKHLPEFKFYRDREHILSGQIANALGFSYPYHPAIKLADEVLLGTEARDLMSPVIDGWHFRYDMLPDVIVPWTPTKAKRLFIQMFDHLNPRN